MSARGYGLATSAATLLIVMGVGLPLPAQKLAAHKSVHPRHASAARSSPQKPPDALLMASLSIPAQPALPVYTPADPKPIASFAPAHDSHRTAVNLNLLLAQNAFSSPGERAAFERDQAAAQAFESSPPDHTSSGHSDDPQFYTRHIPGVGPVVEKMMEKSKEHPKLTRVLESLQPQF